MVKRDSADGKITSKMNYLTVYALFIASLVIYRAFFSLLYILGWKCKFLCSLRYKEMSDYDL